MQNIQVYRLLYFYEIHSPNWNSFRSNVMCNFYLNKYFSKDFIYLFMRDTQREREAETQAEGEAGPTQGARCGTGYRVPRITPGLITSALNP